MSKFLPLAVLVLVVGAGLFVTGCASKPENILAVPYPDSAYDKFTCEELAVEHEKVANEVLEVTGRQREDRKKDQLMGWTSALLFAPAVFFMDGNSETAAQLAALKGKYDSVQRVLNRRRDC